MPYVAFASYRAAQRNVINPAWTQLSKLMTIGVGWFFLNVFFPILFYSATVDRCFVCVCVRAYFKLAVGKNVERRTDGRDLYISLI